MSIYTGEGAWAPAYPYTDTQAYEDFESLCMPTQKDSKDFRVSSGQLQKPLEIFIDL